MAAVTDPYATPAEYRSALGKDDTGEDADVLSDLTAISRYIEQRLSRFFNKDASDVARDFVASYSGAIYPEAENPWKYAKGGRMLYIDDLVTVTSVIVDTDGGGTPDTTYATTDYQLWPLNAQKGPEPRPYTALFVPEWSAQPLWPAGRIVRITGKWGWPSVPEAIKRACIHLIGILRIETPRAQAAVSEIGQLVQMSPQARGIVDDLMRHYARVT